MKVSGKITIAIMIMFFAAIAVLTFVAGDVHDALLPQVKTTRTLVKEYTRTVKMASGQTREASATGKAVPAEAYINGKVFVIVTEELYGRESFFAREVEIEVAAEKEGYIILKDDVIGNRRVIAECTEELYDGIEVAIEK